MNIDVKIIDARMKEKLPQYATPGSAGLDLYACIDKAITLQPGDVQLISTGIAVFIKDPNFAGLIMPRSGMGHKHGIILGNIIGLIDSDYQGTLQMSLWNRSNKGVTIKPMDKVAQFVIVPVLQATFNVVEEFEATSRGEGGFGSTGISGA